MLVRVGVNNFTLNNVDVTYAPSYGIQICEIKDHVLFTSKFWDHARTDRIDMDQYGKPQRSFGWTPPPPLDTFKTPQCDLVETSYVNFDLDSNTNTFTVSFRWDKKTISYQTYGPNNRYVVRHGIESAWGAPINESVARYMNIDKDATSFELTGVPLGSYYALQLCAVTDVQDLADFDWQKDAWLGGMNFTMYPLGSFPFYDGPPMQFPERPHNVTGDKSYRPRCDLVQSSHVSVDASSPSITVQFSWDKKMTSYRSTGPVDVYIIRFGQQQSWGADIDESNADYKEINGNGTTSFTLDGIPRGSFYGVQICAFNLDDGPYSIDWKNDAWLGSMDFTNYGPAQPDPTADDDSPAQTDNGSDPPDPPMVKRPAFDNTPYGLSDPDDGSNSLNQQSDRNSVDDNTFVVSQIRMDSTYAIVLLVLAIVAIISTIVACIWVIVLRRRLNGTKTMPMDFEPQTAKIMPLP